MYVPNEKFPGKTFVVMGKTNKSNVASFRSSKAFSLALPYVFESHITVIIIVKPVGFEFDRKQCSYLHGKVAQNYIYHLTVRHKFSIEFCGLKIVQVKYAKFTSF